MEAMFYGLCFVICIPVECIFVVCVTTCLMHHAHSFITNVSVFALSYYLFTFLVFCFVPIPHTTPTVLIIIIIITVPRFMMYMLSTK